MADQVEVSGKLKSDVWISGSIDADIKPITGIIGIEQVISHKVIHCAIISDKPVDALCSIFKDSVSVRCPNYFQRYCKLCYYGKPDIKWFVKENLAKDNNIHHFDYLLANPIQAFDFPEEET